MYCIEIWQKNSFSLVSVILNKAVELAFQAQIHPALSAPICAPELAARDTAAPAHLGSLLRPMVHTIKPHSICGAGTSHRIPISWTGESLAGCKLLSDRWNAETICSKRSSLLPPCCSSVRPASRAWCWGDAQCSYTWGCRGSASPLSRRRQECSCFFL